jgi:hypothetical protein
VSDTFAFGDLEGGLFGLARAGLGAVFAGGGLAASGDEVSVDAIEPGRAWHVSFTGDGAGFEVGFARLGDPVGFSGTDGGAATGELCRVTGTVTTSGTAQRIDCLGQHASEPAELGGAALRRSLGAWLEPDEAILARAERPPGAELDAEKLEVFIVEGEPPAAVPVADPRLSTQYDPEGRHVRAGLELWVGEDDDYARRAAGEVVCANSFDLGTARLDCAFLQWRSHGRGGAGIYDVLRAQ